MGLTDGRAGEGAAFRVAAPREGERDLACLAHLGALTGLVVPLANVALPGVCWLVLLRRAPAGADRPVPFAVHHAREAFRFHLLLAGPELLLLSALQERPPGPLGALAWALALVWLVAFLGLTVRAAVGARAGRLATYPWPVGAAARPVAEA